MNYFLKPASGIIIYFLILCNFFLGAQDFNDYKNIESSGVIPEDFMTLSSTKFQEDQLRIEKKESNFIKNTQKQFFLESNFFVNEFLQNGKVLFNDPLGIYVNKVLAQLLKNQPELKSTIRVYIVKSSIINAFATDKGIILLNIGLLSKLETEAQLAFVLAHEITHFTKRHVLNRYVQNEKMVKGEIEYTSKDIESKLFTRTTYAKAQEMEADMEGLELLLKTPYNHAAGKQVMEILASDIPFKPKATFDPELLSFKTKPVRKFTTISIDSITTTDGVETENPSHPAISERIKALETKVAAAKKGIATQDYISSKEEFLLMRKSARFELCNLFLQNAKVEPAIFSINQLLLEYPDSKYLRKLLCKSLYLQAKTGVNVQQFQFGENSHDNPRDIQYIGKYLSQLSPSEKNAMAILSYLKFYPDQQNLSKEIRFRDLLYDFKYQLEKDSSVYFNQVKATILQDSLSNKILASFTDPKEIVSGKNKKTKGGANISSLLIIDPTYRIFDLRREKQERYIASEKSLIEYHDQIEDISNKLSINTTIGSSINLEKGEIKKFNDQSTLRVYLEEITSNGNDIIAVDYEKVNDICNFYKTDNLGIIGTYSFHLKKPAIFKIGLLLWTGVVFPLLPLGIYYAVVPTYRTYNVLYVINARNQAVVVKDIKESKFRDSKGVVNSITYYQFQKMRKSK